jgi:hypothetical protein
VLFGLTVVTLVIGKIASERSQATLFLLHTSDRERRLQGFVEDIALARQRLDKGIADQNVQEARRTSKDMATILEVASNYIYFHAYHSKLGDYGNAPALYRLLMELRNNVRPIFAAMSSYVPDLPLYGRLERLPGRMEGTFKTILNMQSAPQLDWTNTALVRVKIKSAPPPHLSKGQSKLFGGFTQELAIGRRDLAHHLTIDKLMKVLTACPPGSVTAWPKGIHKQVALESGISNSMAAKCITQLLQHGRPPK